MHNNQIVALEVSNKGGEIKCLPVTMETKRFVTQKENQQLLYFNGRMLEYNRLQQGIPTALAVQLGFIEINGLWVKPIPHKPMELDLIYGQWSGGLTDFDEILYEIYQNEQQATCIVEFNGLAAEELAEKAIRNQHEGTACLCADGVHFTTPSCFGFRLAADLTREEAIGIMKKHAVRRVRTFPVVTKSKKWGESLIYEQNYMGKITKETIRPEELTEMEDFDFIALAQAKKTRRYIEENKTRLNSFKKLLLEAITNIELEKKKDYFQLKS